MSNSIVSELKELILGELVMEVDYYRAEQMAYKLAAEITEKYSVTELHQKYPVISMSQEQLEQQAFIQEMKQKLANALQVPLKFLEPLESNSLDVMFKYMIQQANDDKKAMELNITNPSTKS